MSVYLDASVVVPLFLTDVFSRSAANLISVQPILIVSNWTIVEVSSVIALQTRVGAITTDEAQTMFAALDQWRSTVTNSVENDVTDFLAATQFVRQIDLSLRAADALHVATALRLGIALMTFDKKMASAAKALGVDVLPGSIA